MTVSNSAAIGLRLSVHRFHVYRGDLVFGGTRETLAVWANHVIEEHVARVKRRDSSPGLMRPEICSGSTAAP